MPIGIKINSIWRPWTTRLELFEPVIFYNSEPDTTQSTPEYVYSEHKKWWCLVSARIRDLCSG